MPRLPARSILGLLALLTIAGPTFAQEPPFDLVIRNGRVVDGTGNLGRGDVAIQGDRIILVGRVASDASKGRRSIDASGLVVSPGFIDAHSHSDWVLFEDGNAPSKVRQGVTTDVLGEDRSGGPNGGKLRAKVVKVGGEGGAPWASLGDRFGRLGSVRRVAINVASYVGLGNVWACVMGDSFDRPTDSQARGDGGDPRRSDA